MYQKLQKVKVRSTYDEILLDGRPSVHSRYRCHSVDDFNSTIHVGIVLSRNLNGFHASRVRLIQFLHAPVGFTVVPFAVLFN